MFVSVDWSTIHTIVDHCPHNCVHGSSSTSHIIIEPGRTADIFSSPFVIIISEVGEVGLCSSCRGKKSLSWVSGSWFSWVVEIRFPVLSGCCRDFSSKVTL